MIAVKQTKQCPFNKIFCNLSRDNKVLFIRGRFREIWKRIIYKILDVVFEIHSDRFVQFLRTQKLEFLETLFFVFLGFSCLTFLLNEINLNGIS